MTTNMPAVHNGRDVHKMDDIDGVAQHVKIEQTILPTQESSYERDKYEHCKVEMSVPQNGYTFHRLSAASTDCPTPCNGITNSPENQRQECAVPDTDNESSECICVAKETTSETDFCNDDQSSRSHVIENTGNVSSASQIWESEETTLEFEGDGVVQSVHFPRVNALTDNITGSKETLCNSDNDSVVDQTIADLPLSENSGHMLSESTVRDTSELAKMESPRTSYVAKLDKQYLEEFKKLKSFGIYETGEAYGNSCFCIKTMTEAGGVLRITEKPGGLSVNLRVPKGALSQPTDIHITVDWDGTGYSPTVRCGPSGTRFSEKVYITMPLYGNAEDLVLQKREDKDQNGNSEEIDRQCQDSGWVENPDSCSYISTKDTFIIETQSFSDFKVVPSGDEYTDVKLFIYVQEPGVGGRVCIRSYLTKCVSHLFERVSQGETGLCGRLYIEAETLRIRKGDGTIKTTLKSDGLVPLESDLSRTTTEECINNKGEVASCYLLRMDDNQERSAACLVLEFPGMEERRVEINLQKKKPLPGDLNITMVIDEIQRQDSPTSIFCDEMIERLAGKMDIRETSAQALSEKMGMYIVKFVPDKVAKHGGSRTRFVLRLYEEICRRDGLSTGKALKKLHGHLSELREEVAADIVEEYLNLSDPESHPQPSQSSDIRPVEHLESDSLQADSDEETRKTMDILTGEDEDEKATKRHFNPRKNEGKKDSGCYSGTDPRDRVSQKMNNVVVDQVAAGSCDATAQSDDAAE